MKKLIVLSLVFALALSITPAIAGVEETGNGAPSGSHYTLNIIGVSKNKTADMDGNNGSRIFVPLEGKTAIYLEEGDDFQVLDANGTDGNGASFQLPNPGLDAYDVQDKGNADTTSDYSVFIRSLGKPGGYATITTCAEVDEAALADFLGGKEAKALNEACSFGDALASVEQVGSDITMRTKGKSSFTNVTAELLTIVLLVEVDYEGDEIVDYTTHVRVPIFNDMLEGEYWEYDNSGLKLLQARFYPVGTDVSEADADLPAIQ